MERLRFYLILLVLALLDSALLASPNLLGKIGLLIYKYHYLRSFPGTLVTVFLVIAAALMAGEVVLVLFKKGKISRFTALLVSGLFLSLCTGMMAKTIWDFSTWSYSHTGLRFRLGAYLLPCILILIFMELIRQVTRDTLRHTEEKNGKEAIPGETS